MADESCIQKPLQKSASASSQSFVLSMVKFGAVMSSNDPRATIRTIGKPKQEKKNIGNGPTQKSGSGGWKHQEGATGGVRSRRAPLIRPRPFKARGTYRLSGQRRVAFRTRMKCNSSESRGSTGVTLPSQLSLDPKTQHCTFYIQQNSQSLYRSLHITSYLMIFT